MAAFLRKYAIGAGADIIIPIIKAGVDDFAVGADWTPVAGDVKVSKDGGGAANIGTLPVFIASIGWKFVFTNLELTAARINVNIVDTPAKAIKDQHIIIDTYGNASAQHALDLDNAINAASGVVESNVTQLGGVVQSLTDLKDFADAGYDPATNKVQGVVLVDTTTVNSDMRGTDNALLAANITLAAGAVTVGTNGDKTGYSLAAAQTVQLNAQGKTDVNNEVKDVMTVDTLAELGAGKPAATPTFETAFMLLYMALRNKRDESATLQRLYNDADTIITKATVSDAAGVTTRAEFVAP